MAATFSVGRIMGSLLLLRQLEEYSRDGVFNMLNFTQDLTQKKEKFGILGNIVMSMLQGIPEQRVLIHEINALLSPYA